MKISMNHAGLFAVGIMVVSAVVPIAAVPIPEANVALVQYVSKHEHIKICGAHASYRRSVDDNSLEKRLFHAIKRDIDSLSETVNYKRDLASAVDLDLQKRVGPFDGIINLIKEVNGVYDAIDLC